jgi:hypothetical protein
VQKANAMRIELLSSMLRRRFKRIVRDYRECLAVIDSINSEWSCEPTDLTPLVTVMRDTKQELARLNAMLPDNLMR